jgi:hypothetical protein
VERTVFKHYKLIGSPGKSPALLFGIQIDIQDVRSGFRNSEHQLLRAPWLDQEELKWTEDLISVVETGELKEIARPVPLEWPHQADQAMLQYLVEHRCYWIWRNHELGIFSNSWEGREDFVARCMGILDLQREPEMKRLREVYFHRFVELEDRLARDIENCAWDEEWKLKSRVLLRDVFSGAKDNLSRFFASDDIRQLLELDRQVPGFILPEVGEKLQELTRELISKLSEVASVYHWKACQVEPYDVKPSYSQVQIITRGILWA